MEILENVYIRVDVPLFRFLPVRADFEPSRGQGELLQSKSTYVVLKVQGFEWKFLLNQYKKRITMKQPALFSVSMKRNRTPFTTFDPAFGFKVKSGTRATFSYHVEKQVT